jgi:predicted DNA-binding protein with PD1-like motif
VIQAQGSSGPVHVLRLAPDTDVHTALQNWCASSAIDAACIIASVGSLSTCRIRLAGKADPIEIQGDLEVLSLDGLLSKQGVHLHIAVSDSAGNCTGGHLMEGCTVRTTLELVVQEIMGVRMERVLDPGTGYRELYPTAL